MIFFITSVLYASMYIMYCLRIVYCSRIMLTTELPNVNLFLAWV